MPVSNLAISATRLMHRRALLRRLQRRQQLSTRSLRPAGAHDLVIRPAKSRCRAHRDAVLAQQLGTRRVRKLQHGQHGARLHQVRRDQTLAQPLQRGHAARHAARGRAARPARVCSHARGVSAASCVITC